ncbi:MAG: hypothetical protein C0402_13210 [Thermodesulfovibrio sp.]|nr:hypothetical protein [Thermodesulfovibrio sp.]
MIYMKIVRTGILAMLALFLYGCNTDRTSREGEKKPSASSGAPKVGEQKTTDSAQSNEPPASPQASGAPMSSSRKLAAVPAASLATLKQVGGVHGSPTAQFATQGPGVAYVEPVEGKFRVVHNGKPGKVYRAINQLIISSDGKRVAYVASIDEKIRKTVIDGREGYEFGADDNHWFTPDGKLYVSTTTEGDAKYIVIENKISRDYRIVQVPVLSADSGHMGFTVKTSGGTANQFIISDMKLQNKTVFDSCGEYIHPSDDGSRVAVGCLNGEQTIVKVIDFSKRRVVEESRYSGTITHMKFSMYNNALSYTYFNDKNQRFVVYNGKEEKIPDMDEFMTDPVVLAAPQSVAVVIGDVYTVRLYRAFQKKNKHGKFYGYISDLIGSRDGRHYAFVAVAPGEENQFIVVDGREGVKFDKIVSPVFSPDGNYLLYRAREAGKRFVVVSDLKGKIVRRHPAYDMVFQPVFAADGKSVSYGVLDGNEFWRKVEILDK